jgi:hypothetical protein
MNRINEISFNSSLMREMRAIAFVTKLIDDGKILDNSMKRMLIHGIDAADVMTEVRTPWPLKRFPCRHKRYNRCASASYPLGISG